MADRELFLIVKGNGRRAAGPACAGAKLFNETWGFVGRQHEQAVRDLFNERVTTQLFRNMSAKLHALKGLVA